MSAADAAGVVEVINRNEVDSESEELKDHPIGAHSSAHCRSHMTDAWDEP